MPQRGTVFVGVAFFAFAAIGACSSNTVIEKAGPGSTTGDGGSTDTDGGGTATDGGGTGTDAGLPPFTGAAKHLSYPQVPGSKQAALNPLAIVVITDPNDADKATLCNAAKSLASSQWLASFAGDYGIPASGASVSCIAGGTISGSTQWGQNAMESYIQSAMSSNSKSWTQNTVPVLYLPAGVDAFDDQSGQPNTQCQFFGGYHTVGGAGKPWAYAQRCPTEPGFTQLAITELAGGHEIAEAATDPQPGGGGFTLPQVSSTSDSPWGFLEGEVGDLCVGTIWLEGGYTYQRIWSNSAAAKGDDPCVPAVTNAPYYNVSPDQYWYAVPAGSSVKINITGWSTAAAHDWGVDAQPFNGSSGFGVTVSTPRSQTISGQKLSVINNGEKGTLTVTAPSASGQAAGIVIISYPITSGMGADQYHEFPIGVYTQ